MPRQAPTKNSNGYPNFFQWTKLEGIDWIIKKASMAAGPIAERNQGKFGYLLYYSIRLKYYINVRFPENIS